MGGGDRKTLQAGNNIVSNCLFHANNRIAKSYRPAVHITGVGNRIVHCEMYDSPSMAILMHGNNHLIENNYIHDVCLEVEDQGAFYYGPQSFRMRNNNTKQPGLPIFPTHIAPVLSTTMTEPVD